MIDFKLRERVAADQKQRKLLSDITKPALDSNTNLAAVVEKLTRAVVMVYRAIPKQVVLPKLFPIKGDVTVTDPVEVKNLSELAPHFKALQDEIMANRPEQFPASFVVDNLAELQGYFKSLEDRFALLATAISKMPAPQVTIPEIKMPTVVVPEIKVPAITMPKIDLPAYPIQKPQKLDLKEVTASIQSLEETLLSHFETLATNATQTSQNDDLARAFARVEQSINALVARPQLTPQPVTHVSINSLRGLAHTTADTVGTALIPLPSYGVLPNRRALMVYNNSSNTIYVGGSDVTTANGMPVPASSYSPILDFGINTILYAIATTQGNNVRTLEVSDEASGR